MTEEPKFIVPAECPSARYYPTLRVMTWHPSGVLDNDRADQTIEYLESHELIEKEPFNRYTDMSGYTRMQIGLDHVVRIARRRRRYAGPPVKSAFYAVRLISVQIARMYEELMAGSKIQVCTVRDRAAAAEWLGVPMEVLLPPKVGSE